MKLKGITKVGLINYYIILYACNFKKTIANRLFMDYIDTLEENIITESHPIHLKLLSHKNINKYENHSNKIQKALNLLDNNDYVISYKSDLYPSRLKDSKNYPLFLFCRGNISLLKKQSISVIGTRKPKKYAYDYVHRITRFLTANNIVVVSGLAKGIDTLAHTSTLKYNGETIAVIGTSLNSVYPAENNELQKQIEEKGLVISMFSPYENTMRWNFINRNDLMSVISSATIVVEASDRSGTLSKARSTLRNNRKLLVPGKVFSDSKLNWPNTFRKSNENNFVVFSNFEELKKGIDLRDVNESYS